jgi:hypothetical protein
MKQQITKNSAVLKLICLLAFLGISQLQAQCPDGYTWISHNSAAESQWQAVTYGKDLFLAVTNSNLDNRVIASPNGTTLILSTTAYSTIGLSNIQTIGGATRLYLGVITTAGSYSIS